MNNHGITQQSSESPVPPGISRAVLNIVESHIAIINSLGDIVATNRAWDEFGLQNGLVRPPAGARFNYFAVCADAMRSEPLAGEAMSGIQRVLQGSVDDFQLEYPCHSRDEQRWFRMRCTSFRQDGVPNAVVAHTSITAAKLHEITTRNMIQAVEQSGDGILIANDSGICIYANRQFSEISGYPNEELVGLASDILHKWDDSLGFYLTLLATVDRGESWRGEVPFTRKDGRQLWLQATLSPVTGDNGVITHYIGVIRDITELKQARERERELEAQYWHAQKLEAIGTLAGGIAHDFNNILSAILGYAELAEEALEPGSKVRRDIECIRLAGQRARDLVHQILTFSRGEDYPSTHVRLDLLVKEVTRLLRATISPAVTIRQEVTPVPYFVLSHPGHMHQVIMNLCTNAYQAMGEEGGELRVSISAVELDEEQLAGRESCKPGPYLKLSVSDTGPGIPPEARHRIFDPFFTTKAPGKGTGLGLPTVHGIVARLNGFIQVETEVGAGTTFHVYLPAVADTPQAHEEQNTEFNGTESILVLDDEEPVVRVVSRMLESHGYRVHGVHEGEEALRVIAENPDAYDLVLTDQQMPRISGREIAARVHEIRPGLPVVVMTGYSEIITAENIQELGLAAVVYKPITRAELTAAVRGALDDAPPRY